MEMRRDQKNSYGLQFIWLCFILVWFPKSSQAYENYTVGDSFGWYDKTEKPEVDYQKWADGKNFSLGDFLIFNTNTNHSVIQTYNAATYKLCDSGESDAVEWSSGNPSNTETRPVTVPVPLLKVGPTFFFSGDYDGDQCLSGQRFSVSVSRGQGLPPNAGGDDSPGPASGPSSSGGDDDDAESAPETNVPANFDHPKGEREINGGDEKDKLSSSSSRVLIGSVVVLKLLLVVVLIV